MTLGYTFTFLSNSCKNFPLSVIDLTQHSFDFCFLYYKHILKLYWLVCVYPYLIAQSYIVILTTSSVLIRWNRIQPPVLHWSIVEGPSPPHRVFMEDLV